MPRLERTAPTGSSRSWNGSFDVGTRKWPATSATRITGTFTRKTEPTVECSSNQPLATGPRRAGPAGHSGPDRDRPGPFLRGEDVDQDRQRRWHDERCAGAHDHAPDDELGHRPREGCRDRCHEEDDEPRLQRTLAAEPVAQRTGGEQEAGEDEGVARDHPLELGVGGRELAREVRQRDVQAGVADDDEHEAQAQDREGPPATVVDGVGCGGRRRRGAASGSRW